LSPPFRHNALNPANAPEKRAGLKNLNETISGVSA
jgi:hypothetical protein